MRREIKGCFLLLGLFFVVQGYGQRWDTYADTWVGTDDLGREVVPCGQQADSLVSRPSAVGMFYYLWHGSHTQDGRPIYDVSRLMEADAVHPQWGNVGEMHWWGKPLLGYYRAGDAFVVAKHLQMLTDAGVDFLFFDVTNGFLYDEAVECIMREIDRRDSLGMKWPQLCFMSYWGGARMVRNIYQRFYVSHRYDKYWFRHEGHPLILADVSVLTDSDKELRNFFTFRKSWAWMKGCGKNQWSWLEFYPQRPGWTISPSVPEQISVSVAQHATTKIGKSYHNGQEPPLNSRALTDSTAYGLYFEEQWRMAHQIHPPVLMVTQFNEWTAQRFVVADSAHLSDTRPGENPHIGATSFVDAFNPEFNRDIEPGWHPLVRDHYYMQLVAHLRRYKGYRTIPVQHTPYVIRPRDSFERWAEVSHEYRDDRGDVLHRHTLGFNRMDTIDNTTGRNDFIVSKVVHDRRYFCVMVETSEVITPAIPDNGSPWITLLLHLDKKHINWYGYDYCVRPVGRKLMLCCNINGAYSWKPLHEVKYKVEGRRLAVFIPRKYLPAKGCIDFKWTDNVPERETLDVLDFYLYGDVAPNGRFNYRYQYK